MNYHEWMLLVKEITRTIQSINEALDFDKISFTRNDYESIQKSNEEKKRLFAQLQEVIGNFMEKANRQNNGFIEILQDEICLSERQKQMNMQTSIYQLKSEIQKGIENLSVNSKIISSNLENLKLLWDQLVRTRKDTSDLYGKSGLIGR